MATKFILTRGIGLTPGSVKYIPTLGFTASSATVIGPPFCVEAIDVYIAGSHEGGAYSAGARKAASYSAGSQEGQGGCV